jgi:uncharacterized membrane protein YebE (DUF533 family)
MFDPQKLLQQMLGGGSGGGKAGAFGVSGDTMKGAALGGIAGLLLGSKSGQKIAGSALKIGGVAVLGGLAYKAWQNWQAQQGGPAPAAQGNGAADAEGTAFLPQAEAERDELSLALLSAMISAAKADGHMDADEQSRIFAKVGGSELSAEEKGFLMDQIRKPLDISEIAAKATSPERAAEIYAASVLAIDPDQAAEKDYLDRLAQKLDLAPALRASIETEAKARA